MNQSVRDVSIIDIGHLFHGDGNGLLKNAETSETAKGKRCEEITATLARIKKVIDLLESTINQLQIKHLRRVLDNLSQLNDYYQTRLKENQLLESAETQFIASVLITKLNNLNAKLGLSDWNILFTGSISDQPQADSLLKLLSEYEESEERSKKRQGSGPARAKLQIKSIFLEENRSGSLGEEYFCSAYQFESNEFLVTEFKNNQTLMQSQRQPRSKSHAKPAHLMTKRSSSADLNSLKSRRSNRDSRDKLSVNENPALAVPTPDHLIVNIPTRLNEKCIAYSSFKFKFNKPLSSAGSLIDIQPNCKYMIILIYRLVKPNLSDERDQFKLPIKYIQLNEHHLKNASAPLLQNYKLPLSPVIENMEAVAPSSQPIQLVEGAATAPSSSVFRRMFMKRSKSINRSGLNNVSGKGETEALSIKPPVRNLIDIDLSFEQSDLVNRDFNIETFKAWINMWRPKLDAHKSYCQESSQQFELLTIYLNDLSALNDYSSPSDLYFLEVQDLANKENLVYFHSNLFRPSDKINDLYQIRLGFEQRASLRFFLFRFKDNNIHTLLATSSQIEMSRRNLLLSEISLIPPESSGETNESAAYNFYTLKLQCSFQSELYPTVSRVSIDLFNYKLTNRMDKEKELLQMVDVFAKAGNFNEPVLIRKFLEFFAALNTNAPIDEAAVKVKNDRRNTRALLLSKVYEVFVKVTNKCFYSCQVVRAELSTLLKDFKCQPKQAIHFLLYFLKNQLDTLMDVTTVATVASDDSDLLVLTFKTFDKLIEIIHFLSSGNNQSKLELKYEINDLIVKLFGPKSPVNSSPQRRELHFANLNLKFLDTIAPLFSGAELASLVHTNFLIPASHSSHLIHRFNTQILSLNAFNSSSQLRDALTSYLLKSNNLTGSSTKHPLTSEQLNLIESLLRLKFKLSKQNSDQLASHVTPLLIHSLASQVRIAQELKSSNSESMTRHFLCLIDLLSILLQDSRSSKALIESSDKNELNNVIEILLFFFKCDTLSKLLSSPRPQLWRRANLVVVKFAKHAQKYLQLCLITAEDIHELSTDDALNVTNEQLVKNYIDMVFAFVDTPTSSFSLTIKMKLDMLQTLQLFWQCLNINLKRSSSLNELIIKRLCHSILSNFYFKLSEPDLDSPPILYLNPFVCQTSDSQTCGTFSFYEKLFQFLSDLLAICSSQRCLSGSSSSFQAFIDLVSVSLVNSVLKREKLNRKHKETNCFQRNCSRLILDTLETSTCGKLFQTEEQRKQVFGLVRTSSDFSVLKDDTSSRRVSIIEKYLVTYELLKQIDRVSSLAESKRNIKLHLLSDLYCLHKLEKNYLHMSFVRKEQGDLLDWNYSRKSSNEPDQKEIMYLESLKKFAESSQSTSSQSTQSEPGTGSLSSSLSSCKASSMSSYMSSQSSIDSNSSTATSPSSSPSSSSSSPMSTPSSLSLSASLKLDQTGAPAFSTVQSEICKQLCAYYEKLEEGFPKYTRTLSVESKFIQLAAAHRSDPTGAKPTDPQSDSKSNQHGHLYFRIGIFGSALALTSISNKYFLYKHHSHEMLSNIQSLILGKMSRSCDWHDQTLSLVSEEADESSAGPSIHKVSLLHHNQMPDVSLKQSTHTSCLQICAVNRLEAHKLLDLVDEMVESAESEGIKSRLSNADENAFFYYFDRPFYMPSGRLAAGESVENLWIERSLLLVDEQAARFENLIQFEEIKTTYKVLLNPVRNAINDIREKTKELRNFIVQFSTINGPQISQLNVMHNLQPLTMRLLGCLDARVNGGLIKYVKELLCQTLASSKQFKKKDFLMQQLYHSIKDQLEILESGLSIHNRILKSVSQMAESSKQDGETESNSENLKHMNQLNEHLNDCLGIIEQELNDRWSKFNSMNTNQQSFKEKDCKKLNLV